MAHARQSARQFAVTELTANPANIRDSLGDLTELALSIREVGILQPLTVTEDPHRPDRWLLLDGHRRLAACQLAHVTHVPVIIRHGVTDTAEQLVIMLISGTHRRDLTPVERAKAYGVLRDQGLTLTEIARRTGTHFTSVSSYLNLLRLAPDTLQLVEDGDLPVGQAIAEVREERQAQRVAAGHRERGRPKVTYFHIAHPLHSEVVKRCNHVDRPIVGKAGCGPCWEQTIRDDERTRQAVS